MTNSTGSAAQVAGLMPGDASNTLANEDLLPTTAAQRHWTWKDFAALWVGMVVCVPTYTMASSMLDQGFTWQMAVWLVFLANCIVLVPMVLIGRVGPRYGVPFPVLARASFGVKGANLPAVLRGLVACGWFSINCYFGALALHGFLNILGMNLAGPADGQTISTSQFMCFLAFWAVHIWFIWKGPESIRMLEVIAAPLMIIASIALVVVLVMKVPSGQSARLASFERPDASGAPPSIMWRSVSHHDRLPLLRSPSSMTSNRSEMANVPKSAKGPKSMTHQLPSGSRIRAEPNFMKSEPISSAPTT